MKLVANHIIYLAHDHEVKPGESFEIAAAAGKALVDTGAARGFSSTDAEPVENAAPRAGDEKQSARK